MNWEITKNKKNDIYIVRSITFICKMKNSVLKSWIRLCISLLLLVAYVVFINYREKNEVRNEDEIFFHDDMIVIDDIFNG